MDDLPALVARAGVQHSRTQNAPPSRMRSSLIAVAVLLCWGFLMATQNLGSLRRSLRAIDARFTSIKASSKRRASIGEPIKPEIPLANGATGERFGGYRVRDFGGRRRSDPAPFYQRSKDKAEEASALKQYLINQPLYQKCKKWAVVTTIYAPSEAIKVVGSSMEMRDWCMVVVADTNTPEEKYLQDTSWNGSQKAVLLSVSDQQELAKLVPFVQQTPFHSFARKNIGYLYAIWMGASVIFDFDDDNMMKTKSYTNNEALWSGTELMEQFTTPEKDLLMVKHISVSDNFRGNAFNPFPKLGATVEDSWPRGLPLSLINSKDARGQPGPLFLKEVKRANVAVIQSTADHDPDVDAIYRLSRPLPFEFESSKDKAMTIEVPRDYYSPYNAQATLHLPIAYWGMYLPMTVAGRVSDIWRSYVVQRLLKEVAEKTHVLYSPPIVTQFRNDHDYLGDFSAEQHLYLCTEALLQFLEEWRPNEDPDVKDNLQSRIEDLWIGLYERQFVELKDVEAIQGWLNALEQGGYIFPPVQDHSLDYDVSTGGMAARQECARQRLLNWTEPIPTMMNGSNYGALKLQQHTPNTSKKSIAHLLAEYELQHPFPHSIDLVCRAGGHHGPHEMAVMIESIQLYWPKCAGHIVLVLDRGDEEFAHEHIPSWIEVLYSKFPPGMPGRLGNQLFNMYSDQVGRSEYIATIDSDVALTTPVTPDLVFNLNKRDESGRVAQIALAETTYQKGFWTKGDQWMFQGDSEDWNFMITLPIVFPRPMFPQYRAGVEAIHDNQFETTDLWEHFRTTVRGGWMAMSQFCLLGNWMVRQWKDGPIDLRNETDVPPIRYGVHLSYYRGIDFSPYGRKHPESFQAGGRRVILEGLCELFCSQDASTTAAPAIGATLDDCSSLCPNPVAQPRQMYFKYEKIVYGTEEQRAQVAQEHFQPLRSALAVLIQSNVTTT